MNEWTIEQIVPAAAVEDRSVCDDLPSLGDDDAGGLPRRFSRRHDILDDRDAIPFRNRESAPKRHHALFSLREHHRHA